MGAPLLGLVAGLFGFYRWGRRQWGRRTSLTASAPTEVTSVSVASSGRTGNKGHTTPIH